MFCPLTAIIITTGGKILKNRISVKKYWIFFPIIILAAVALHIGNTGLVLTYISVADKNVPEEFDGYKIVHISDLHNTEFGINQKNLIKKINSESPDLIVITGDFIDSRNTDIDKAVELITGLKNQIPIYYVTGNHESRVAEYKKLESELIKNGVNILRNKNDKIEINGSYINIIGIDDPSFGEGENDLTGMISELKSESYDILLSHRPELFDIYCQSGVNLSLCGHAHGGQVIIPFIGGLVAPNQGIFPEYTEGIYEKGNSKMIVSRGLGNSIIPMRINNPPELVVITLENKA